MSPPTKTLLERLSDKFLVGHGDECWPWVGARTSAGYGSIKHLGVNILAHRAVYELLRGAIPEGLQLDHECHNRDQTCDGGPQCQHRRCVNPSHLIPRTSGDNSRRGTGPAKSRARQLAKTHCPQGHPYSGDNLYVHPSSGGRICRTCVRSRSRRRNR